METLAVERDGGVVTVTLNRPEQKNAGLELFGVQEYRSARRIPVDVLEARVRAHAYSTFSLHGQAELTEALECFVATLRPGEVEGTDENTLVIARRTAA